MDAATVTAQGGRGAAVEPDPDDAPLEDDD